MFHAELKLKVCVLQDLQYDPEDADDFSTLADQRGREILEAQHEEKRKK